MKIKSRIRLFLSGRALGTVALAALLCLSLATPGEAVDLSSDSFRFVIDTTLSWGLRYRLDDPDPRIIGTTNGGTAYSVNGDDGNLNFGTGVSSNAIKATIDLDMGWQNFGAFVRGSGFYDYEIEENDRERTQLTDVALDRVGSRAELLDAYLWWQFPLGDGGGEIRVGQQVVSWGESTFIQGGINIINPVDVSAIRVPGAELREALLPVGLVWTSFDITRNFSFEGFYQYDWEPVIIDPPGSYFSTNDFAGVGGTHVFLAFGDAPDSGQSPPFIQPPLDRPFLGVPRGPDVEADDSGQYGLALRWLVPAMGNTEFGLYYINYHSRLPTVNGTTGTLQGAAAGGAAAAQAAAIIYGAAGVPGPGFSPELDAIVAQAQSAAFTDGYAATANYFIAYPEDIKLYGLSFNSQLGTSGIALQGEVAYREDAPYQMDDVEILFAALSPISPGLALTNQVAPGGLGFEEIIIGTTRQNSTQVQATATKIFGPILGADQGLLLLEAAYTHVSGLPDKSVLRYEGPGTYTSGNPIHSAPGGAHAGKPFEPASAFADPNSWGYRLVGRLVYNNAIGPLNLIPRFGWQHDVSGVSPGPGGNFIEGRTALTLGLGATYLSKWQFDLSYTSYSGASRYNLINDRDFLATNIKFSF